jgi:putative ABC transport system ATP-binding protein
MVFGYHPKIMKKMAGDLLEQLGMSHRLNFLASQISGGELQRVAIARALVNDPPIILADEPTAHLDQKLSLDFLGIMQTFKDEGKTIVMTSHDPLVTEHETVDLVIELCDGRIV